MKSVYNGYKEKFLAGNELKKFFRGHVYCDGRHHENVRDLSIEEYLTNVIDNNKQYRIFYNDSFCKILNASTDGSVDFFSHIKLDDEYTEIITNRTKPKCDFCSSDMIIKQGRYGPFWRCCNYPNCKGSKRVEYLGYFNYQEFKPSKLLLSADKK